MPNSIASVAAPTSALELLLLGMRSSLFTESAMKQFLARHPAPTLPDLDAAARLLVADNLVSKFQAELLLLGHPEGLTLGRYRLIDLIGKGGMGRVFLARDPQLHRRVAVKVLSAEADRADLRGRFLRETRAAAALVHPNVVAAYDSGEQGGALFLVMEFVSGITLHAKVFRNGPLPIPQACDYVRQAALGLAAVHAAGLIHRDVKPSNLIVTDDGVVKLLDLGLARFIEPTHPEDGPLTLMHNLGQVLGTPQFLAPEQQARSDQADHRSDIFGLGAVLFFLLTGRFPSPGPSLERTPLPSILTAAQSRPDLPRELSRLLGRLLATDPAKRPRKAEEVATELAAFCGDPASASVEKPRPTPRLRLRRAAIIAGLLASTAGAFFALRPPSSVPPPTEKSHCVEPPVPAAVAEAPAPRLAVVGRHIGRDHLHRRHRPASGP
jgi:eukaryotic-like serine/threonine-protein kinase